MHQRLAVGKASGGRIGRTHSPLLLLGSDAFETYREILQGRLDLAAEWEPVSRSTDFGA